MTNVKMLESDRLQADQSIFEHEAFSVVSEARIGVARVVTRMFSPKEESALGARLGLNEPTAPNTWTHNDGLDAAWIAPGQWLVFGKETRVKTFCKEAQVALAGDTAMVINMTDQLAAFRAIGSGAATILSSLIPIDLSVWTSESQRCGQTLFGECGVFVQALEDPGHFRVIVDQSFGPFFVGLLSDAAKGRLA